MESADRRRVDILAAHLSQRAPPRYSPFPIPQSSEPVKYSKAEPVVIGGMVLDIHATPSIPANPRTTTPGKVQYVLGGVARNVALCMSKLGITSYMISAVGLDMAGKLLLEHWRSSGLSIEGIQKCHGISSAAVCNIFDANGELAAAVANFDVIEKFLNAEWVQKFEINILTAPVLMVDANINHSALESCCHLAVKSNIPVWFEPVSVAKSRRVALVAKYVTFTSPNEDELIAMANSLCCGDTFSPIQKDHSRRHSIGALFQKLKQAVQVLLENGIATVLVTLGSDGVFLCSKGGTLTKPPFSKKASPSGLLYKAVTSRCPSNPQFSCMKPNENSGLLTVHFPALPASVAKLTGAGDCLVGGTIASIVAGLDIFWSVAVGIATAKGAVESDDNVPAEYGLSKLADDARRVYDAATVLSNQSMM